MHIAAEKAQLDRGRYFLALAKDCSPFRIAWLKIYGFKNGQRQIEGRTQGIIELSERLPLPL